MANLYPDFASVGHIPSAKREYPQYRVAGHEANNLGEDVCYEFKHGITLPSERVIQQHFVRWDPTFLDMPNLLLRRFSQLLRYEARAGVDDAVLLFFGDFCEHRERQHGSGRCFADRIIADFVAEVRDALLQVQRQWVIDFAADAAIFEVFHECVAMSTGCADDVLIERVGAFGAGNGAT